eukprot:gene17957-19755_t
MKSAFRKHSEGSESRHVLSQKSSFFGRKGSNRVDRPKSEAVKNARGKAKDSLEYELDHVLSDHFSSDRDEREPSSPRNEFINFYNPDTGLERLHSKPSYHEGLTSKIEEPHLRFNYGYESDSSSSSLKRHGSASDRRVDSYAGEMIDDENTLSHYIAPPVYDENHRHKSQHTSPTNKMLFGGSEETENAESANTKSFMKSLGSLLKPLSLSQSEQRSLEAPSRSEMAELQHDVDYQGGYSVMSKDSRHYKDGGGDDWSSRAHDPPSGKHEFDNGPADEQHHHAFVGDTRKERFPSSRFSTKSSDNEDDRRDESDRGNYNRDNNDIDRDDRDREHPNGDEGDKKRFSSDDEFRDFHAAGSDDYNHDKDDYSRYDRSNYNELSHTRSTMAPGYSQRANDNLSSDDDHSQQFDSHGYPPRDYANSPPSTNSDGGKEGFLGGHRDKSQEDGRVDSREDSRVDSRLANSAETSSSSQDKPIEMMQDQSGKLHSLSQGVNTDDLTSDIQKYLPHE